MPSSHVGPSPFPVLDEYVTNVVGSRMGMAGTIRAWNLLVNRPPSSFAVPHLITYNMKGNRYCERIRREHKSNNVMWNVDLLVGSMTCYQTCHDPECQAAGFRGQPVGLPLGVQDSVRETLFE